MRKKIFGLMLFLIGILMSAAVSAALPVTIDKVKVDGAELTPVDVNRLDVERGQKIDVSVTITALEDLADAQVEAFISGYEHGTISDSAYFDATTNTTYVKHFTLEIPDRVEKDDYVLRVLVTSRATADELMNDYRLKISSPRHAIAIKDVIFRPESVEAGRAVIAVVRVKNMGEKDEDGIKVTAAIPKLGVSDSDYIDDLEEGETTSSEELWLKIADPCVETGSYDVKVIASFQDGDEETSKTFKLDVVKSDACEALVPVTEEIVIVGFGETQDLTQGAAGAIYPITITNAGAAAKTFTVEVIGADWADFKVSPSQVVAVGAGETQTVSVYLAAKESAAVGEQMFAVSIKDSAGNIVEELTMKANIKAAAAKVELGGVRRALEIVLVALIVLLVIIGLIVAFTRLRGGPEEEAGQTYY
jgi:uncharacterized membrane protein